MKKYLIAINDPAAEIPRQPIIKFLKDVIASEH